MQQNLIKITEEQLKKIRPYMPNVDNMLNFSLHDFLSNLDDAIFDQLDKKNDYEDTETSIMLQNVYDEIYDQNKK
jgi:hypothetical protein